MPISLHDAFVPTVRQTLGAVNGLIGKAERWCAETGTAEAAIVGATLHDTMLPFSFQIRSVAHHSLGAIEGVRAGLFDATGGEMPGTLAAMKDLLGRADAGLAAVEPEEMEGFMGKDVAFDLRGMKIPFVAENFLLSFSQPNFFFHAATAYDLLRSKGVPLGKRDFLGQLRVKI
ncbi:DUF1993 domain-containing protein [Sandaracinobacter sp. RS1-74]|uniref:DUF1993 domain-containing protein n=1 Tax=Sandaracinobacteroides sayramensis TaxID=2913411 RepID=UPI001EDA212D|nr:DUF1993 domain-containing protein [Sandaracinobacteroides sayramensis]MCG2841659.1 DUF1993 domain-containing protein [Sandaracinobacteroides sayramensis]